MDYEDNHYYHESDYKNLQRNPNTNFKNEYEVVNVENHGEEEQKNSQSDENFEKSPESKLA